MSKPDERVWPNLKKAWDAYGHSTAWKDLIGIKWARTHGYVVVAWKEPDGLIDMADLASPDGGETWEMQNDGHTPITMRDWNKLRCVDDCDWFIIPGNPDYQGC